MCKYLKSHVKNAHRALSAAAHAWWGCGWGCSGSIKKAGRSVLWLSHARDLAVAIPFHCGCNYLEILTADRRKRGITRNILRQDERHAYRPFRLSLRAAARRASSDQLPAVGGGAAGTVRQPPALRSPLQSAIWPRAGGRGRGGRTREGHPDCSIRCTPQREHSCTVNAGRKLCYVSR